MTIEDYEHQFLELSCYVPYMVANKNNKLRRFEDSLNLSVKVLILACSFIEFGRLVHVAKRVEQSIEEEKYFNEINQARRGYFKSPTQGKRP